MRNSISDQKFGESNLQNFDESECLRSKCNTEELRGTWVRVIRQKLRDRMKYKDLHWTLAGNEAAGPPVNPHQPIQLDRYGNPQQPLNNVSDANRNKILTMEFGKFSKLDYLCTQWRKIEHFESAGVRRSNCQAEFTRAWHLYYQYKKTSNADKIPTSATIVSSRSEDAIAISFFVAAFNLARGYNWK